MKKILVVLAALALAPLAGLAVADWDASFVVLNSKEAGNVNYDLNVNTTGPDLPASLGTFDTTAAGQSLVLNGGVAQARTSGWYYYDSDSFVLHYRVYPHGGTAPDYSMLALDHQTHVFELGEGWTGWGYDKMTAAVPLIAPGMANGDYDLDIVMSKKEYWNSGAGSFTSYIPGGQSQGDFPAVPYRTGFTVIPEPATAGLLGLFGVVAVLRRRFQR